MTIRAATKAEELGFWGVSMPDHYIRSGAKTGGTLDSWFALAHLGAKTSKIHIGTMVTPIPLRPPALLAKIVSTVDVLSNGRTFLGVGAGWSRSEFDAYSEWDEPGTRVSKTEEGVRLILDLWTKKQVEFEGKYYHSKEGILEPKPIQKPHPPLLFGGSNPRMLELAGKYSDIVFLEPDIKLGFDRARQIVQRATEKEMRQTKISLASTIPRSVIGYDRAKFASAVSQAGENGCEYFDFSVPDEQLLESMADFSTKVMSGSSDE